MIDGTIHLCRNISYFIHVIINQTCDTNDRKYSNEVMDGLFKIVLDPIELLF